MPFVPRNIEGRNTNSFYCDHKSGKYVVRSYFQQPFWILISRFQSIGFGQWIQIHCKNHFNYERGPFARNPDSLCNFYYFYLNSFSLDGELNMQINGCVANTRLLHIYRLVQSHKKSLQIFAYKMMYGVDEASKSLISQKNVFR